MRKSFIVHFDSLGVLDDMTTDQCGELFMAIKAYQLGESIELSPIVKVAFSPFKNQFIRDEEKYQSIVERNRNNGLKGGRPKNPKEPTGLSGNPKEPKKADSDSDSKSDSNSKDQNTMSEVSPIDDEKRAVKEKRTLLINNAFDFFWDAWPTKKNKQKAYKSFVKLCRKKSTEGIETFVNDLSEDITGRVAANDFGFDKMHATTYLNNDRWEDDISQGEM